MHWIRLEIPHQMKGINLAGGQPWGPLEAEGRPVVAVAVALLKEKIREKIKGRPLILFPTDLSAFGLQGTPGLAPRVKNPGEKKTYQTLSP